MSRTTIANPRSNHPLAVLFRGFIVVGCSVVLSLALFAVGAYVHFSRDLPDVSSVTDVQPAQTSVFHSARGTVVGRFAEEYRERRSLKTMPLHLIQAFLSAEDKRFFSHRGVDWRATVRAMLANLRAGRTVQGASTITQQVCKRLVGKEKSYIRKAKEAILARRMESSLGKLDILALYLNDIYLGQGAHGVQAAARHYFRKDVAQLSLAESAMLAGLPPQPSVVNPVRDLRRSKARQAYVLDRMVEEGFISPVAAQQASASTLQIFTNRPDEFGQRAPHFTEHARQYVLRKYGQKALYRGGLKVDLTVDLPHQYFAQSALRAGLNALGKRQGYTGPILRTGRKVPRIEPSALSVPPEAQAQVDDPWHLALVAEVRRHKALVRTNIGDEFITLSAARWAKPYDASADKNSGRLNDLTDILKPGDWVWVSVHNAKSPNDKNVSMAVLEQRPPVNGGLISLNPKTQEVVALIGGYDFDESEFNRITQACRQPGSIFKPIIYSQALSGPYTLASLLSDSPITVYDRKRRFLWKPKNLGGKFRGQVMVRDALINSLNTPSIRLIDALGPDKAVAWSQRLGVQSPLYADSSLVLGSSCVKPMEMTSVFSTFLTGGDRSTPIFVKRVRDRNGGILEDRTAPSDVSSAIQFRIDAVLARALVKPEKTMNTEDAYLIKYALRDVVRFGTASDAKALKRPSGGKTGTTDKYDAWYVGFTDELLTTVWVGTDQNQRALGRGETGGRNALPIWLKYMNNAVAGRKAVDFTQPVPPGIVFRGIDRRTGLLARGGRPSVRLPFRMGTEPSEKAETIDRLRTREVEHLEGRF